MNIHELADMFTRLAINDAWEHTKEMAILRRALRLMAALVSKDAHVQETLARVAIVQAREEMDGSSVDLQQQQR